MSALRVALTFDAEHPDRPAAPGVVDGILDILEGGGVPAAFFAQGRWAEAYPDVVRRAADGGHLIGNHSHYHARMPLLNEAGIQADVADAEAAIHDACGISPRPWFRCPFGAGATDERILDAIGAAGYRHIGWHVAADDWDAGRDAGVIVRDVIEGVREHGDGAVVLLHSWPTPTVDAVAGIVDALGADGATFCRLDELDDVPTGVPG